jgi:hypothetical protein
MKTLDVMLLESDPGAADDAAEKLKDAGHRVHRCHEFGLSPFPCNGILDPKRCPLMGPVDVALLVRQHPRPRPTPNEDGVSCAIRARIPIVVDGPGALDPFEPWEAGHAEHGEVVEACLDAAARGTASLIAEIKARTAGVLVTAGVDPELVACRVDKIGGRTQVHFVGPIPDGLRNSLAVRVLDTVRAAGRTFGQVDVSVEHAIPRAVSRPEL